VTRQSNFAGKAKHLEKSSSLPFEGDLRKAALKAKDAIDDVWSLWIEVQEDLFLFDRALDEATAALEKAKKERAEKWKATYRPLWVGDRFERCGGLIQTPTRKDGVTRKVEFAWSKKAAGTVVGVKRLKHSGSFDKIVYRIKMDGSDKERLVTESDFKSGLFKVLEKPGTRPDMLHIPTRDAWRVIRDAGKVPKGYTKASIGDLLDAVHKEQARSPKNPAKLAEAVATLKAAFEEYHAKLEKEKKGTPDFVSFVDAVLRYLGDIAPAGGR
jgi:hypothetical protein